ncbi:uncharacterized protein LOC133906911 isoform X2 [Phragmites australis]|uniref:uncharacterized protein LOC133906911 isoform X2 n=1 Tax=Phragmites australis TaxID=29695 RepID=UPI002D795F72|nr:uncharacterized protein LOC133906911 isoform X2 [Phragmites australis]
MMDRFFSYASTAPRRSEDAGITLLSGPPCCGKTSLLFQFAVNRAAESGRSVVFICSKGRLESNPPFLSQGVDPSMSALHRVQIKYVEDGEEIRNYFAAFHLHDNFPAAVIVDDFADFFSESAKLGTLGSCELLLSDVQHGDTPRSLFIYKRWISSIYTIQGDGVGSYILSNIGNSESGTKEARTAKYSIALQYLVLEEIRNG